VLRGHGGGVSCVRFSSDHERLASGSHDYTIRVWISGIDVAANLAYNKAGRDLTREEWEEFVGSDIDRSST
jgi:WD40 repeat protein